jgi:hypothetical protein
MPTQTTTPTAKELGTCALLFIEQVLCGNAVLLSSFKTFLNTQILLANGMIAALGAQLIALDIINSFVLLEINTVAAVTNKIKGELNVVFGPMTGYASCPAISKMMAAAENLMPTIPGLPGGGMSLVKILVGIQAMINEYNRRQYIRNAIEAAVKQLQEYVAMAQAFLNKIDELCQSVLQP